MKFFYYQCNFKKKNKKKTFLFCFFFGGGERGAGGGIRVSDFFLQRIQIENKNKRPIEMSLVRSPENNLY